MDQKIKKKGLIIIEVEKILINGESYLLNNATGEIIDPDGIGGIFQTYDEINTIREFYNNKKEKELKNRRISKKYEQYGNFIWYLYELSSQSNIDISPNSLTKLFYLITYMNYDSTIECNNRIMNSKDITKIMKLSTSGFYLFINELINKGIVARYGEDGYKINQSYFRRGDLKSKIIAENAKNNFYFTKIYIDGIRALYEKVNIKQHGKLSMIFKILPYVNRKYNIICSNPLENNLQDILPLSPQKICDIVGYDIRHMSRLFSEIKEIKFQIKDRSTTLLRFISDDFKESKNVIVCINPQVYYGGDVLEAVKLLGKFETE